MTDPQLIDDITHLARRVNQLELENAALKRGNPGFHRAEPSHEVLPIKKKPDTKALIISSEEE